VLTGSLTEAEMLRVEERGMKYEDKEDGSRRETHSPDA